MAKRMPKEYYPCPTCDGLRTRRAKQCMKCTYKRPEIEQPSDPTKRAIALTQGRVAIVDATEYDRVTPFKWAFHKSKRKDGTEVFYAVTTMLVDGEMRQISMHRFILGIFDPKVIVDHKEPRETLNNCRSNLRIADSSTNQANKMYYGSASGYKGVAIVRNKPGRRKRDGFRGVIRFDGKREVSPIFSDPLPAAQWYDTKAREHFGEFARVNFPS